MEIPLSKEPNIKPNVKYCLDVYVNLITTTTKPPKSHLNIYINLKQNLKHLLLRNKDPGNNVIIFHTNMFGIINNS